MLLFYSKNYQIQKKPITIMSEVLSSSSTPKGKKRTEPDSVREEEQILPPAKRATYSFAEHSALCIAHSDKDYTGDIYRMLDNTSGPRYLLSLAILQIEHYRGNDDYASFCDFTDLFFGVKDCWENLNNGEEFSKDMGTFVTEEFPKLKMEVNLKNLGPTTICWYPVEGNKGSFALYENIEIELVKKLTAKMLRSLVKKMIAKFGRQTALKDYGKFFWRLRHSLVEVINFYPYPDYDDGSFDLDGNSDDESDI